MMYSALCVDIPVFFTGRLSHNNNKIIFKINKIIKFSNISVIANQLRCSELG